MTHTFTLSAMTTPLQVHSHGKVWTVMCCPEMWHSSWWSFMDELETRERFWNIQAGDVVLDVGADYGSYTLSALAMGAEAVYAWSPPFKLPTEPLEAATLCLSAGRNGWSNRMQVSPTGLYDRKGWLAAFDGPRNAQWFATEAEAKACIEGQDGHCAVFEVDTLDSFPVERCDWLKVDTEGCELPILQGGVETIKRCRPRILLEHHYHLDEQCEEKCTSFLKALGYEQLGRIQHHTIAHSLYVPVAT
jgi:FkbM family methyltransferase